MNTKFVTSMENYFNDEDDSWVDYKCDNVRFPEHDCQSGDVVVYDISELVK